MKRKLIELSIKMGFFDKGEGSRTESEDSRTLVRGGTIRCIDVPLLQWGVYATGTLIREDGVPVPVRGLEGGNSPDLSGFLHAVRKEVRTRLAAATSGEEPDFAAGESVPGAFR